MLADWVVDLDEAGSVRRRVSLTQAFAESSFKHVLERIVHYDVFHTNSVKRIENSTAWGGARFDRVENGVSAQRFPVDRRPAQESARAALRQ